ncbi:MAG: class I SAM-dependent methyltransferase [Alphaproteobacteria bacterium]
MVKLVYRTQNNKDYWNDRWSTEIDQGDQFSKDIYPIKYVEMICQSGEKILEIGVGGGRVLNYCKFVKKFDVQGIENSEVAVNSLIDQYGYADILHCEDCASMSFDSDIFDVILAFGVYHNFDSIDRISLALQEAKRVAKSGAKFCISLRPDNAASNINEWLWKCSTKKKNDDLTNTFFHRMLIKDKEAKILLSENGFYVEKIFHDQNYPILRKFKIFAAQTLSPRTTGYKLNALGKFLNKILCFVFPYHNSNISVFMGTVKKS